MLPIGQVEYQADVSGGAAAAVYVVATLVGLAILAVHIYVLIDLLKHDDYAWQATGQKKNFWIGLWAVALLCCGGIGTLIIDAVYWFSTRPRLLAARGAPGTGPGYGAPPPGYGA